MENIIAAKVGKPFSINLPSFATSGYEWILEQAGQHVKMQRKDYVSREDTVGGKGEYRFQLLPGRSGVYTLTFVLKRPWEEQVEKSASFQVKVVGAPKPPKPRSRVAKSPAERPVKAKRAS